MKALILAALLAGSQPTPGTHTLRDARARYSEPILALCGSLPFIDKYGDWVTTRDPGPDGYWVDWDCPTLNHWENHI